MSLLTKLLAERLELYQALLDEVSYLLSADDINERTRSQWLDKYKKEKRM